MSKGKYQSKAQISWLGIIIFLVVLALIGVLIAALLKGCGQENENPDNSQANITEQGNIEQPDSTKPEDEQPTEPTEVTDPTEDITEPTEPTEPTTEPTEEPTESTAEPTESEPTEPPTTAPQKTKGEEIAEMARSLDGKPEKQQGGSGDTLDGFDMTGFVRYCYRQCGIVLPGSYTKHGTEIRNAEELMPGDILFIKWEESGDIYDYDYVAIYLGGNEYAAVSDDNDKVVVRPFSNLKPYFVFARRCAE